VEIKILQNVNITFPEKGVRITRSYLFNSLDCWLHYSNPWSTGSQSWAYNAHGVIDTVCN